MQPSSLEHRLTQTERERFERDGYLVVEGALDAERVELLTVACDRIHATMLAEGSDPQKALFYPNFLPDDPLFLDLVDEARVFPKVWGILGWNILLYHAHLIVTPGCARMPDEKTFGWHQDSGRVNREIESRPRPRLSLKAAYFLSDCSEPGRGNFWILPGSHLRDEIALPDGGQGQPEGAIPVCAGPGTAVLFDRRLWHTASPNWSNITRKALFYGYAYRWLRTKDDMTVQALLPRCDAIRKQLLGWGVNCNGFYTPADEDVPLRAWLREHSAQDAE